MSLAAAQQKLNELNTCIANGPPAGVSAADWSAFLKQLAQAFLTWLQQWLSQTQAKKATLTAGSKEHNDCCVCEAACAAMCSAAKTLEAACEVHCLVCC